MRSANNTGVASGSGYAVLQFVGSAVQRFCRISLIDATLQSCATISNASSSVAGLALQQDSTIPVLALSQDGRVLMRFLSNTPNTISVANITGVQNGETLVGLDFRPSTGQLYSLGINNTTNAASLYRLDPISGAATLIGAGQTITFVNEANVKIDLPAVFYRLWFSL